MCSAIQYSAIQYSAIQYSAMQNSAVQYSAVQCSAVGLPITAVSKRNNSIAVQFRRSDSRAVESPDPGSPHEKNFIPIRPSTGCDAVYVRCSAVRYGAG